MLRRHIFILFAAVATFFLTACKADFSPNAQWKEIPVVYCILDQDDDTTWVRVQRCYLGEGNMYQYSSVYDSVNYPQGTLQVTIEKWRAQRGPLGTLQISPDATAPIASFGFQETMLGDKPDGNFSFPIQPAFCCRTAGMLDTGCVYRLLVVRNNDTLAKAVTPLVGGAMTLREPTERKMFQFSGTSVKKCILQWTTLPRARQYQPSVRFFYNDFVRTWNGQVYDTIITPHHIDIQCPLCKSSMRTLTEQVDLYQSTFLSTIQSTLQNDTVRKVIVDTVLITVNACTEDLAAYLFSVEDGAGRDAYTNIHGGLGIFAARRTHISFPIPTPPNADSQYKLRLKELGVGF